MERRKQVTGFRFTVCDRRQDWMVFSSSICGLLCFTAAAVKSILKKENPAKEINGASATVGTGTLQVRRAIRAAWMGFFSFRKKMLKPMYPFKTEGCFGWMN